MSLDVQSLFVSQKLNKIRWIPEEYSENKYFVTGSWDDYQNSVKVWSFESENEEQDAEYPKPLVEYYVSGDVTEIKFVDNNKIAVSTSEGWLRLLEISAYDKHSPLREIHLWKNLHNFGEEPCSCTALDTLEGDIVSVGEDGNINVLSGHRKEVIRSIKQADSCSLSSVCFTKHNEVITGNLRGHIKTWDTRTGDNRPAASFLLTNDEVASTCLLHHPTQPHIILAGTESGSVVVWDTRMKSFPSTLVSTHSAGVNEMQFHPENPHKMVTCATSGELWVWNMEEMTRSTRQEDKKMVPYMPLQSDKAMGANALISPLHAAINSLDCHKKKILCSADNEAIYCIKNFKY